MSRGPNYRTHDVSFGLLSTGRRAAVNANPQARVLVVDPGITRRVPADARGVVGQARSELDDHDL